MTQFNQRRYQFKRAPGRTRPTPTYLIEGESVTTAQIAERLGLHHTTAANRLRRAKALPGPVTWQRLRDAASSKDEG